jgi:GDPmannose 4,6-dehydratase
MYGNQDGLRNEDTPLSPTSPYGVSKTAAHKLCEVYRARGIFAVGGILFNHESPRRGPEMVTRKITLASADWARGKKNKVKLGNMDARRDWGFAGDYVEAMWMMLQQDKPDDYVVATGETHSVRELLELAFSSLDLDYRDFVEFDPRYTRPSEVEVLLGDATKARKVLGWRPKVDFPGLVKMMIESDLEQARREKYAGTYSAR